MRGMVGEAALVDSGASENFIDQRTVERWGIATRQLPIPVRVTNVDGTNNWSGAVTRYAVLHVTWGSKSEELLFLVANLGQDWIIFGFTWLKAFNLKINWTNMTWDDLPIEVATRAVTRACFLGVEDHARQRLREADVKQENSCKMLAHLKL
jgi:gag-polyprotein putative aspartyl protease